MSTLDIPELRAAYTQQYPAYRDLVDTTKPMLTAVIERKLKDATVDGRPKAPSNFIRKAVRKHLENPEDYQDPLTRITDRAGLRVITAHLDDAKIACDLAGGVFDVFDIEHTAERWKPNELGYSGIHLQARLYTHDVPRDRLYLRNLDFEIQVHTKAQNAWSTVSHAMTYKPAGEGSRSVESKIYRAIALVSLFDEQIAEARAEMLRDPGYHPAVMLETLHREFLDWLEEPTDDALSLRVLEVVQRAYAPADDFTSIIETYVRSNRQRLDGIFATYRDLDDEPLLLFQPEVVAIAERLQNAPNVLVMHWQQSGLPYEMLDEVATALGLALA